MNGGAVPAEKSRCLVTGATGYIGGRLVPRLLDAGLRVRAMARNPDKLADVPWRDDVEVVRGDLTEPGSLIDAFDGVDVVYYLVHSMGTSKDFVAEERRSAAQRGRGGPTSRGAEAGVPQRTPSKGRGTVAASGVAH